MARSQQDSRSQHWQGGGGTITTSYFGIFSTFSVSSLKSFLRGNGTPQGAEAGHSSQQSPLWRQEWEQRIGPAARSHLESHFIE